MHVTIEWDTVESTILCFTLAPETDWPDFWEGIRTAHAMIAEQQHQVHVIVDTRAGMPPSIGALGNFRTAMEDAPENQGILVLVGVSHFMEILYSTFTRVYRPLAQRLRLMVSVEDARAFLIEEGERIMLGQSEA